MMLAGPSPLTPMQTGILHKLRNHPQGLALEDLVDAAYPDREPPAGWRGSIRCQIQRVRRRAKTRISCVHGVYVIETEGRS